jgi:hypothetical protein
VDTSVEALCGHVYRGRLTVANEDIPHELVTRMVTYICQNGLLQPWNLKQFIRPQFSHISVPGCILMNDQCVEIISSTCPLIKSINCAYESL